MAPKRKSAAAPAAEPPAGPQENEETAAGRSTRSSARKPKSTSASIVEAASDEASSSSSEPAAKKAKVTENVRGFKFAKKNQQQQESAPTQAAPVVQTVEKTTSGAAGVSSASTSLSTAAGAAPSAALPFSLWAVDSPMKGSPIKPALLGASSAVLDEMPAGKRRNSLSLRGKRQSASGQPSAVLHPSLDSNTLYKHIAVDIFPILRMHQLLLWCFQRRNELMEGHEPAFVTKALQGVVSDLQQRKITVAWYGDSSKAKPKQLLPNPRNEELKQKLAAYTDYMNKLKLEAQSWDQLHKTAVAKAEDAKVASSSISVPVLLAPTLPAFVSQEDRVLLSASALLPSNQLHSLAAATKTFAADTVPRLENIHDTVGTLQRMEKSTAEYASRHLELIHSLSFETFGKESPAQLWQKLPPA